MTIELTLAVCVMILSASLSGVSVQAVRHFKSEARKWKFLNESIEDEAREWERKAVWWAQENIELRTELDEREHELDELRNPPRYKPVSEGASAAHDFDVETIGLGDEIWDLVREFRDLMPRWELKVPHIAAQLPHRRYSEFAQMIGNISPDRRTLTGIEDAIEEMVA